MEPTTKPQPRILKWTLIIAITIVANLFINYAISLGYKEPTYDAFCPQRQVNDTATQSQCVAEGGQWNANDGPNVGGYCNPDFTCSQNYTNADTAYQRNVFVTLVVIGVILIALALMLRVNSVVTTSLSLAGSLTFLIASVRYWGQAHDWLKLVILGIALAALITLAIKKFNETVRP